MVKLPADLACGHGPIQRIGDSWADRFKALISEIH
jgi:hypothetical protein